MSSRSSSRRRYFFEPLEARCLLAADFIGSAGAAAALDAFLEIYGLPGRPTGVRPDHTIEVQSFSWGATQTGALRPTPATADDFDFVAAVNKASPLLFQAASKGEHFSKAVLHVRKAGGDQQDFLKVTLQDVLVSSVQTRSINESLPLEEVSLTFSRIQEVYVPTLDDGRPGTPVIAQWNLTPNRSSPSSGPSLLTQHPAGASGRVEAFLQIAGIQGESNDSKHKGSIDIESFSWGMSNAGSHAGGGGGGAGKVSMQDFHFVMPSNKASPQLLASVATGRMLPEATLLVRHNSPGQDADYLKYKLENVLVSSIQTQSHDSSVPMEEVSFNFTKLTQWHVVQNPTTGRPETAVSGVWDNRKLPAAYSLGDSILDETQPSPGTVDMFLEVNGIPGESADSKHKGTIEIESFSWGMSRAITDRNFAGGANAGKVNVQDFHFVTNVDKSSPALMLACATGQHISKAVLFVRKSGGQSDLDYLKYKFSDLLVSSYQMQSVDESQPLEEFSLQFRTLNESYTQTAVGGRGLPAVQFNWAVPPAATRSLGPSALDNTTAPAAAVDMFLEIEGIPGESTDSKHKGEIEILSFSWGATQTGSFGGGGGGGAGRLALEPFQVVTPLSQASPSLFSAVLSGQHFPQATLHVRNAGTAGETDYLKIKLSDVLVSSYQTRSVDQSVPLDGATLNFARLDAVFQSPDASGTPESGAGAGFDVVASPRRVLVIDDDLLDITSPPAGRAAAFIKFDGIDGESALGSEVQSFSWGVSNPGSFRSAGGGGAGKVSMQDFHFVTTPNRASPELVLACANGTHFPKVELDLVVSRPASDAHPIYLKFEMEDTLVSSYQISASSGALPLEEVTLNFTGLQQQYGVDDPTGEGPPPVIAQWSNATQPAEYARGKSILDDTRAPAADVQMFLAVEGVQGESADQLHKGSIEIESFSWGLSQQITSRTAGGGAGKVSMQDFHFVADFSKASPQLFSAVAKGKHFPTAVLTLRHNGTDPLNFLKYELTDVLVSSYQTHGHGDAVPTDQFSLNFENVKVDSQAPTPPGAASSAVANTDTFFATL